MLFELRSLLDETPGVGRRVLRMAFTAVNSAVKSGEYTIVDPQELTDPLKYDGKISVIDHLLMSCTIADIIDPTSANGREDCRVRWPKYFGFSLAECVLLSEIGRAIRNGNADIDVNFAHGAISAKWITAPRYLAKAIEQHSHIETGKLPSLPLVRDFPEGYYGAGLICLCQVLAARVLHSTLYVANDPIGVLTKLFDTLYDEAEYRTAEPLRAIIRKTGIPEEIWSLKPETSALRGTSVSPAVVSA